ncbi:helix-turn-helix domain-containing protein [Sphingomonas sp. BK580]|uniref:helix-turn-helix domain-containing protein n=1 Tax=Sphingomonas sp. BK580 TaxID=2586972 RepID=UPI00160D5D38|nr:helix-turn-helix transcriptional regulator [Sphingomonas sp. BK580]MBB3693560.1 transcriptional regulator with XRE-family HTH domain [Sphingomonas sp. BK580]
MADQEEAFSREDVGGTLKRLRSDRGMSQRAVADRVGLSRRTVMRAESGAPMRRETLELIEKALDAPPGTLVEARPAGSLDSVLGRRLRDRRREIGLRLGEVARFLGKSPPTLWRLEQGHRDVLASPLLTTDFARVLNFRNYDELVAFLRGEDPE